MTLAELLKDLRTGRTKGQLNKEIKNIAYDSRLVKEDFIFVAVRGFSMDGHDYIKDAINRGATAIITEKAVELINVNHPVDDNRIAFIEVSDSREALALISSAFYGHPSRDLSLVGITGTNGKTTTSFITKSIINAGGSSAGILGSIQYMTGGETEAASNTTPESLDLQRYLYSMKKNKMEYAVIEVSSHALSLKRVLGCEFNVAAFTNFSQDHLDFHGTMDDYFSAKTAIFDHLGSDGTAVLNWDDPMVRKLADKLDCNVVTCGTDEGALFRAENIFGHDNASEGVSFDLQTPDYKMRIKSHLIGKFNVYNILISAGIASVMGISKEVIQKGVHDVSPVEGRFEYINEGQKFMCIVDYAHTEDALRKIIQEARSITEGRIITVFGCGGDRDRGKRPLMGLVASEMSDLVVITSDNPRSEKPVDIINDIVKGIKKENYTVLDDRAKAIREAVSLARKGDTVLVAGKGHEDYQEVKGIRNHFSDKEVLREEIRKRLAYSG